MNSAESQDETGSAEEAEVTPGKMTPEEQAAAKVFFEEFEAKYGVLDTTIESLKDI